jgi:hypothetical protein
LLKHEYVAQESYEQAAPTVVSPTPDEVTHVFRLFCGVASADVELWQSGSALTSAVDDTISWKEVVGVDAACGHDLRLFRVLEGGGIEIE